MGRTNVRVALFGLYGVGNLGNEGSLEAAIDIVHRLDPDAVVSSICEVPARVRESHGIDAVAMFPEPARWMNRLPRSLRSASLRLLELPLAFSTVRRFDVVIIPGSGMFEQLGAGPWGVPYTLFRHALAARLLGRRFAIVGTGAEPSDRPLNRWFMRTAIRLATYVSFRDEYSKNSMLAIGASVSAATVHPDVAFARPATAFGPPSERTVAVGVMDYHGLVDKAELGTDIHERYVGVLTDFVEWLTADGFAVRLVTGSRNDFPVATEISRRIRERRPDLAPGAVAQVDCTTLGALVDELAGCSYVVATRFHNIVCALQLGRPTISLSYGPKNDVLMADAGLGRFCQPIESIDPDLLRTQFMELVKDRSTLADGVGAAVARYAPAVDASWAQMWREVRPGSATR